MCRHAINYTLNKYDRGVRWEKEEIEIHGQQWITAYLPVWLYSFRKINGNKDITHYVAVNGRTKKISGSIPIDNTKLFIDGVSIDI